MHNLPDGCMLVCAWCNAAWVARWLLQVAAQVRKADQQEKTIQGLHNESKRLKDQIQSLTAARQKLQDSLDQQRQVKKASHGAGQLTAGT